MTNGPAPWNEALTRRRLAAGIRFRRGFYPILAAAAAVAILVSMFLAGMLPFPRPGSVEASLAGGKPLSSDELQRVLDSMPVSTGGDDTPPAPGISPGAGTGSVELRLDRDEKLKRARQLVESMAQIGHFVVDRPTIETAVLSDETVAVRFQYRIINDQEETVVRRFSGVWNGDFSEVLENGDSFVRFE